MPSGKPASKPALASKPSPSPGLPCSASSSALFYFVSVVLLAKNPRLHEEGEVFSVERQAQEAAAASLTRRARGESKMSTSDYLVGGLWWPEEQRVKGELVCEQTIRKGEILELCQYRD